MGQPCLSSWQACRLGPRCRRQTFHVYLAKTIDLYRDAPGVTCCACCGVVSREALRYQDAGEVLPVGMDGVDLLVRAEQFEGSLGANAHTENALHLASMQAPRHAPDLPLLRPQGLCLGFPQHLPAKGGHPTLLRPVHPLRVDLCRQGL